ncbi:unnamed protein product, partial [Didymodactylos carnosus]
VFNEETLEQHEKELEEMKTYYNRNEQIFIELHRWLDAWEEYKKFEATDEYEQTHGHSFHVDGISIIDFFTHEKENYSQEKELEKARKQLARGQTPVLTNTQQSVKRQLAHTEVMKTPSKQQQPEVKPATPFRPSSAMSNKRFPPLQPQQNK